MTPEQRDEWTADGPYYDIDGNECTLDKLCRLEPAWAANVIRSLKAKLRDSLTAPPWTSEAPTVGDRWYWWRRSEAYGWTPLWVFEKDGVLQSAFTLYDEPMPVSEIGGQWSGPLPEPKEGDKP